MITCFLKRFDFIKFAIEFDVNKYKSADRKICEIKL